MCGGESRIVHLCSEGEEEKETKRKGKKQRHTLEHCSVYGY